MPKDNEILRKPRDQSLKSTEVEADLANAAEQVAELLKATVMMVDDEPTTLEILQAFLEDAGYQNFIATTESPRALDLVANERPDVVLLDLNMPQVNGFEILTTMRADSRFKHIPVIVLTSSNDSETKLKALRLGASDFLAKPVDSSELALRLRNTLAAKAYQDRLAYYDELTNLPNRRLFMDRVRWAFQRSERDGTKGAVLHVDLDRFKQVNDTLGPRVGDLLLESVARRLQQFVREVDTVSRVDPNDPSLARIGGDEFTVVLADIARAENAATVAHRVLAAFEEPFNVEGHDVFVTCSIGIGIFPDDGADIDTLLKHADIAMHHAKQHGGNTCEFYSAEMNARAMERLSLENRLRTALERDELFLVYQPKVEFATGNIIGSEALLRWQSPELGLVSPLQFISLAEETGLIVSIGKWVLETACKQNRAWHQAGHESLRVSVNVSGRQFRDREFIEKIRDVLASSQLEAQFLTLELTESLIMDNAKENVEALHQIKEMGITLSIDDFGTGYSSLSYLRRFPLDELKVDRSFVQQIPENADDVAITTAIIAMAHSLRLAVVAEGVETEEQLQTLKGQGCDEYQGFFFSKPVPKDEFTDLLTKFDPRRMGDT